MAAMARAASSISARAAPAPPARRDRAEPRGRHWGSFFALLLVLAAIAAVGAALIASNNNGNGVSPVNRDQVQQQIDGLRQFLEDNTKR